MTNWARSLTEECRSKTTRHRIVKKDRTVLFIMTNIWQIHDFLFVSTKSNHPLETTKPVQCIVCVAFQI